MGGWALYYSPLRLFMQELEVQLLNINHHSQKPHPLHEVPHTFLVPFQNYSSMYSNWQTSDSESFTLVPSIPSFCVLAHKPLKLAILQLWLKMGVALRSFSMFSCTIFSGLYDTCIAVGGVFVQETEELEKDQSMDVAVGTTASVVGTAAGASSVATHEVMHM